MRDWGAGISWRRLQDNKVVRVVAVDEEKLIDQMDAEALQVRHRGESVFAEYLVDNEVIEEEIEEGMDEYEERDQHKVLRSMLNKPV